jgi:oligopeptide transport system substrate-binding protein
MRNFLTAFIIASSLFFNSCTDKKNINNTQLSSKHGGIFNMSLNDEITTLYPSHITQFSTLTVSSQIYEGLVKLNSKTLKVEPAIASSWNVNDDATVYSFNIRKDLLFHNTDSFNARKVTPQDIKDCFTALCHGKDRNFYSDFFTQKVKGASNYFEATKNNDNLNVEVEGLKVLNDSTFVIELNKSFRGFEKFLTIGVFVVYPPEIFREGDYDNINKAIGTGPFKIKNIKDNEIVELVKNENYWKKDEDGFVLPYLDAISFSFPVSKTEEVNDFTNGKIDLIKDIPVEEFANLLPSLEDAKSGRNADFNYLSAPGLDVKMIMFNHKDELFSDVNVRKAFNLAVDRGKLVDSILLGDRNIANNGLIPHGEIFGDYKVKGFIYNPERAKELFTLAGYPDGKDFPSITIHGINRKIDSLTVNEVARMISETLNIKITVDNNNNLNELLTKYNSDSNTMQMWRFNWIADYPDPENFLQLFYGKNTSHYKNELFAKLLTEALEESNENERYKIYFDADQTLIDDAAFIPLLYNDLVYLTAKKVKNFNPNSIDFRDLSEVYFEIEK